MVADSVELEQHYRPAGLTVSAGWDRDEAYRFVEELFAKHQHEIYAYLLRMLRDPELAADLTQDAFVKAYRAYDSLEKPENARAWLYQIAHRVALDNLRRHKIVRFVPLVGEARSTAPSAEHLVMDARLSGDLQRALERIPERQRTALLLAELHDLTGLELAAALGVSHVAARALLTRARESLRQALAVEREAIAAAEAADASDIDRGAGRMSGRRDHGPRAAPASSPRCASTSASTRGTTPGSTRTCWAVTPAAAWPPTTTPSARCSPRPAPPSRSRRATCGPAPPPPSTTRRRPAAARGSAACTPRSRARWSSQSPSGSGCSTGCPPRRARARATSPTRRRSR